MNAKRRRRTLFRHPMAALGGALVTAGGALFLILLLLDFTQGTENPYRSLVTFVIVPTIMLIGLVLFLLSIWIQVRKARKKGEDVKFNLSIDPSDPGYMKNLWLFLGIFSTLIILLIYSGTRAYEATDSVGFCGETCHEVMGPQNVTYHNSPHARVACVECHIGPGASFWVKAKFDGIRQLFATANNSFSRPIETPVHNLRPAQETCESCHWPQQFYGEKMVTHTYYKSDEENSPWTIKMLVKIGGGNPRTGKLEGIHWHMIGSNKVEYIATDTKRHDIPWIRLIKDNGDTLIYTDPDADPIDLDDPNIEVRQFDCMDCHNRPSHLFLPPAKAINLALSGDRISTDLPFVREAGLKILVKEYIDMKEARTEILLGLTKYYEEKHPEIAKNMKPEIFEASKALLEIYEQNFFPEMKTDYRVRENYLSHFVNNGCFRCHDRIKENERGEKLSYACNTCHLIVAQGPSSNLDEITGSIIGLDFEHPEDIDEAWKEMLCTDCHDHESGY
ncbi:MAG: NapC/NirT family cytochrome c [Candidatus Zixiibacteriota bacterium]